MPTDRDPLLPYAYRVVSRRPETADTVTLELSPVGEAIRSALPGQFCMLWAPGVGEVPISFAELPGPVHTVRAVGPVTEALARCQPGDLIGVRGPFGTGWPQDRERDLVLVAGGIGLAPLRPVVLDALARRADYGRVALVVGARSSHDLVFRSELDGWWREGVIEVRTTVDAPCSHWPTGAVGVVTRELQRVRIDPDRTTALLCGPEVMMRIVAADLRDRGMAPQNIHASLERNMQCGIGRCGHCQLGALMICRDGPVFSWDRVEAVLGVAQR